MPPVFGKSQGPCKDSRRPVLSCRYLIKQPMFVGSLCLCWGTLLYLTCIYVNGDQFYDYSINTSAYVNYCFLIGPFKSYRLLSCAFSTSTHYWCSWTYFKRVGSIPISYVGCRCKRRNLFQSSPMPGVRYILLYIYFNSNCTYI
jgi:hypothetical protein